MLVQNPLPSSEKKTWRAGTLIYTSTGLVSLFLWLLFGDFAWSMRDRSVGPMAQWYLKHLEVSNLVFGLLVSSFPALLGLILVPIVSIKSDRHRGGRGRRIPYLLATTPIAAIGMIGIGLTPLLSRTLHRFFPSLGETTAAVISFGVFWAIFEFATMAGQAVFGGLINDVVPKPLLGRFYGLFRAVSLVDGIIFNYWVIGHVPTHFTIILTIIGVFYTAAFMWVCIKVKEGDYPPPGEIDTKESASWIQKGRISIQRYFRECFRQSYYVSIFLMLTLGSIAFLPVNAFSIPYAQSLGMDMEYYGKCLALTFLISFFLSYFIGWLADIFHPIRMSMIALAIYVFVSAWGYLEATTAASFALGFVMHAVVAGIYATSVVSLGQRLYPHFRFAQFSSAGAVMTSIFTMCSSPITGLLIDASGAVYQYTFLVGGGVALLALVTSFYTYRKFLELGGPENYTAPEP